MLKPCQRSQHGTVAISVLAQCQHGAINGENKSVPLTGAGACALPIAWALFRILRDRVLLVVSRLLSGSAGCLARTCRTSGATWKHSNC